MTMEESKIFVDEVGKMGDVWTSDQVMQAYSNMPLQDAITERRASVEKLSGFISSVLDKGGN